MLAHHRQCAGIASVRVFDLYLAELGKSDEQQLNDPLKMEELARAYDIINLGDVPERPRTDIKQRPARDMPVWH